MKFELNNKNNKGITLIVLVITIIVLLILTAVTFTYLFGEDGLVQKAKWGKFATEFREIEERVEIYVVDKQIEELQNGVQLETGEKVYPVSSKLTMEEKQAIKANKSELAVKIMQLTEKEVEEVNLYWIEQEKIGTNKKDRYLIDIDTNQIYQYEGKTIYGLKWHTLDDGVKIGSRVPVDSEELWDGWIRITLYYPSNSTERQWRLGQEGETRYDKTLMWQDYTGPIWVRLTDVENVWIKYKIDGEEQIVAPNGRLAVDIQPDSYLPTLKESVKVKIYYDKEAELKEYKIGNSEWQEYTEEFIVTENTIVEARAKKKVKISDDTGEVIGEKEIWGRDNVYIGNIGIEEADLPAPTLKRKEADSSVEGEVAKVEASYPEEAVRKIYKINYGEEKEYTEEISIKRYGTYIIAYYYNNEGKRSRAAQILINDPSTGSTSSSGRYVPNGSGWPGGGNSGSGGGSGSTGSNPTTPSYVIEAPNISVNPTTVTDSVQVTIRPTGGHTAEKIYYKIGYGSYQEYTTSISLTYNTTVSAYYITDRGERSSTATRRINNIQVPQMPYVKIEADPDPYNVKYDAKKVTVTITATNAETIEYSLNGITYNAYTTPLEITENRRVYAKGTNENGETIEYIDITNITEGPTKLGKLSVSIDVDPEPKLTSELIEKALVTINYDDNAEEKYYKINNGAMEPYTQPFEVEENCTVYAYAVSSRAVGQTSKQIDNLTTGISKPEIVASPKNGMQSSVTTVTINFDRTANIKRYKIDNGSYINYSGPIEITENCTITAYNKNELGYEATSSYTVNNILKTTTVLIDKGKYFILKLNYPPDTTGQEYKWQDDGVWTSYKQDGILLIKPEYKDEILNAEGKLKIKIENEEGREIDFNGDYYFVTKPIQELIEHIYMRWNRLAPQSPQIILNTEEPTREVKVTINYSSSLLVRQYRIIEPDGTSSGWQEYTNGFTINKKNTIICARGQDEAEVWTEQSIKKITNIDEEPPEIRVTADLETRTQKVGIKVQAVDDVRVDIVMWAEGIRQDSYFDNNGTVIPNNSIFYVTENTDYTIYAKDGVGNTSTYTLQVGNVDLTPPTIRISVNPEDSIKTEVTVSIDYGDSTLKQYKVGESNTKWTTYTTEFNLTSDTVIANKWKNEDNTVTIYAKGQDSAGNEQIQTYKVLTLDVDAPNKPVIQSNYGYPILTEQGVKFDGKTTITYDTRNDIDNYYSIDNGDTWKKYTGTFEIPNVGTIMAKSVKKGSGLEVIANITVSMPKDALPAVCYDGNEGTKYTSNSTCTKYINVSNEMIGKKCILRYNTGASNDGGYIIVRYYNSQNKQISATGNLYGTSIKNLTLTIPNETVKIGFYMYSAFNYYNENIYELTLENTPTISNTKYYPIITEYGIESGYNEVTIDYFQTSVQRLYKIGEGEWQTYQNRPIRLELGQTISAKGIDKDEKETRTTASYTSTLPSDALGTAAYDGDEETKFTTRATGTKYINVSNEMIGKKCILRYNTELSNDGGYIIVRYYNNQNKQISATGNLYGTSIQNLTLTIPNETVKIGFYMYSYSSAYGVNIYELTLENTPTISNTKYYPVLTEYGVEAGYNEVTIDYFQTSVQRLYKIGEGEWQTYQNRPIRLELGQTISAKGIDKDEKETRTTASYTSTLPSDALGTAAYDGDEETKFTTRATGTKYINVSNEMIGKKCILRYNTELSNDGGYIIVRYYNNQNKQISATGNLYGTSIQNLTLTIPNETVKIGFYMYSYSSAYGVNIYELKLVN